LDTRPTTEQATVHDADQPPVTLEEKPGVKLPLEVSQLRWKLGRKAKRRAEIPVLHQCRPLIPIELMLANALD
jgi:hypothetical protein